MDEPEPEHDVVFLPVIGNDITCTHCDWRRELCVPLNRGPEVLNILSKYEALQQCATQHPDTFREVIGKEPAAAMAEYDQELAAIQEAYNLKKIHG